MNKFTFISLILSVTAAIGYINRKYLKLHPTIGAMTGGFIFSLPLIVASSMDKTVAEGIKKMLIGLDFKDLLLSFMLGFLLFAGSLHVRLSDLLKRKWPIAIFSVAGVVISAFITAGIIFFFSGIFNLQLKFIHCLLFGALISPTDPIAVLAILQKVGAPKDLETDVCGESLFNDGVGVVMFLTVLKYYSGQDVSALSVSGLFLQEAIGGFILGMVFGYIGDRLIKSADDSRVDILITLAIASGGFTLANSLEMSGPIAMVVAGVMVGNFEVNIPEKERSFLDNFWEVIDEAGNTILFALVGLQLVILGWAFMTEPKAIIGAIIAIPTVLIARFLSLAPPLWLLSFKYDFPHKAVRILTWGGLRGGLPLAMALSLFGTVEKNVFCNILAMTFSTVAFSIIVQGLTVQNVIKNAIGSKNRKRKKLV